LGPAAVANSNAADGNHHLHLSAPSDIEELSCSDEDNFCEGPPGKPEAVNCFELVFGHDPF
jgi:hypothetical protein